MSSESLFSEFLVTSVLHGVDLESVRVTIDEVRFSEEVRDWVHHGGDCQSGVDHDLLVWNLRSGDEHEVFRHVMSHLWCRGRSAVFVLDHTIVQLWWHCNNHVIVVWVEVATLWNIKTEWWGVVVTSQQVVWIVGETRLHVTCLGQIWWPDTLVSVLGLMDGHVWWPDAVVNFTLSEVPLLEVIRAVLLMTWMDLWQVDHL